jgi:hypothetical protein
VRDCLFIVSFGKILVQADDDFSLGVLTPTDWLPIVEMSMRRSIRPKKFPNVEGLHLDVPIFEMTLVKHASSKPYDLRPDVQNAT